MESGQSFVEQLTSYITDIVSETNGITLMETLNLMAAGDSPGNDQHLAQAVAEFRQSLSDFQIEGADIHHLIRHPFSQALYRLLKRFPLPYREEHIHLTGSLDASFVWPRLEALLDGPGGDAVRSIIERVYGPDSVPTNEEQVTDMIRLKDHERFDRYLKILLLPKLVLTDRQAHRDAAYHMAKRLYTEYNVGHIRLKFTLSRATSDTSEQIPGIEALTPDDIALGLYEGFMAFKHEQPVFNFILSPCFRKETDFYDARRFPNKRADVTHQIATILELLERHPVLRPHLCEVDTVGAERHFYSKPHFQDFQKGFRKLHCHGFHIRSHHGETWHNLRRGIQAVDNAMNIWHIDTLEHGLSLGINPNYYFHSLFQRVCRRNLERLPVEPGTLEHNELTDMLWNSNEHVLDKLLRGDKLNENDARLFTKAKFHTAREVEHYQHDVLNRMIHKEVSLVSLPSSNYKLTSCFDDYKDHPFSWWEKKGVRLGVGTDNDITLNTNFIQEMLILLLTDPMGLKLTKLLMITTGENRRPHVSHLLWKMHS